jgi:hypothetical protein
MKKNEAKKKKKKTRFAIREKVFSLLLFFGCCSFGFALQR